MINNMEQFRTILHKLVNMDYGFEAYGWNWENNFFRFSFYHLNSCYNAFATVNGVYDAGYIDWQYASENKRAGKYALEIARFIVTSSNAKREQCLKEIGWYAQKAHAIFEAKYSYEVYAHDWNGEA